jgi:hypothetical protein
MRNDGAADVRLAGWKLPPLCPMKSLTGRDCPGCGLTRSFVAIAHGDLHGGVAYHRLGLVLFVAAVYQLWYRPWMIARGDFLPPGRLGWVHRWASRALIVGLLANWLFAQL